MKKSDFLAVLSKLPADFVTRSEITVSDNNKYVVIGSVHYFSIPLRKIKHAVIGYSIFEIDFGCGYFRSWLRVDTQMLVIN